MSDIYDVAITVKSQSGICHYKHKPGDRWMVDGSTPAGVCLSAFNGMFKDIWMLRFGGRYPWSEDVDIVAFTCPDVDNPVVFEIQRIRKGC